MIIKFGKHLFDHQTLYKKNIITYEIWSDLRDFIVSRVDDEGIDENIFPVWFHMFEPNGDFDSDFRCSIINSSLKSEIEHKIREYLN